MRRRTGRKKLGVVKIAAIIVALLVVVSAIGGGGSKEKAADDTRAEVAETTKAAETTPAEPAPEPAPEAPAEPAPAPAPSETASLSDAAEALSGVADKLSDTVDSVAEATVNPDFKREMDAYEAFFVEYVDFMKSIENEDMSSAEILTRYNEFIQKETEYMQALQAIQSRDLSAADLAYYMKVYAHITALLETL